MATPLVEVLRGRVVETIHRGDVAVVDSRGRLLLQAGSPARKLTYWRSGAKPLQAMPLVYTGALERLGLGEADLAVACASHNGEDVHVAQVAGALERAHLPREALICHPAAPWDAEAAAALRARGEQPTALHHRCSGKHLGMLAVARYLGADLAGYGEPDHPVQQAIRENLAVMGDVPWEEVVVAQDGCGVPTFAMPVDRMALAFARLADPDALPERGRVPATARREAARQVAAAMAAHPYLVAGRQRLCTDLAQLARGRVIAKSGSAGLYCAAIFPAAAAEAPGLRDLATPGAGVGIALKLEDGHEQYTQPVLVEVLARLGVLSRGDLAALAPYHRPAVHSGGGALSSGGLRTRVRLVPGRGEDLSPRRHGGGGVQI